MVGVCARTSACVRAHVCVCMCVCMLLLFSLGCGVCVCVYVVVVDVEINESLNQVRGAHQHLGCMCRRIRKPKVT